MLEADFLVHSDTVGGLGFGLYVRGHWCVEHWHMSWHDSDVMGDLAFLELFPLVVAVHIWTDYFLNATILF